MLAIAFKSSPAAFMNSASICSVKVERTPAVPRAASRSSSRSGGSSERTVTSKSSRGWSPASGISRVTRIFSGTGSAPLCYLLNALLEKLSENGLQDTAVPEIFDLYRRVHPRPGLELPGLAVVACGFDRKLRTGFEVCEAGDVVGLLAGETQRLGALAVRELEGQDAHPDQVGAVDALEALGYDGFYPEEERALGCPVTRGAGTVLLAGNHDERHALLLVPHARLVDRGLLSIREVDSVTTLLAACE